MKKFIYKICSKLEWLNFQKKQKFYGTRQDIIDGYIHFSDKNQVISTLSKLFFGKDKLILLKVDTSKLENLIREKSTGGKIFVRMLKYVGFVYFTQCRLIIGKIASYS